MNHRHTDDCAAGSGVYLLPKLVRSAPFPRVVIVTVVGLPTSYLWDWADWAGVRTWSDGPTGGWAESTDDVSRPRVLPGVQWWRGGSVVTVGCLYRPFCRQLTRASAAPAAYSAGCLLDRQARWRQVGAGASVIAWAGVESGPELRPSRGR